MDLDKLIVEWSTDPSPEEQKYKDLGFKKTTGTVFIDPPSNEHIIAAFNKQINGLSEGARALQKHADRSYSNVNIKLTGNNQEKNQMASDFLDEFLKSDITWKNIHSMDAHTIIYELRNNYYGMRWNFVRRILETRNESNRETDNGNVNGNSSEHEHEHDDGNGNSDINELYRDVVDFRGMIEPYEVYVRWKSNIS